MKNVSPHNKDNAIKSVAFVFELDKEINETTILSIQEWYKTNEEFKNFFTIEKPIQSMHIQIDGSNQEVTSSNVSGMNYLKVGEDETTVEWMIRIDRRAITITCNLYTRWDEVWGYTLKNLEQIVTQMNGFYLAKIALEYLDEFRVFDKNSNVWLDELFKKDTDFIPKFVYKMNEPWHTHNGFIKDEKDIDLSVRTVHIVNITYQKTNIINDIVTVQTQHASSFYNKVELSSESIKKIDLIMKSNHLENKKLFNNFLSNDILAEIKLKV